MAIYTRTGDDGTTSLLGGKRVPKSDLRIECLGSVDELNSLLGVVLSMKYLVLSIKKELIEIQKDLIKIGSILANPKYSMLYTKYFLKRIENFELIIDTLSAELSKLNTFILPGGGKTGAMLHFARSVCRRAERNIVKLSEDLKTKNKEQGIENNIIVYFNRLSDLLFTMAHFVNFKEKRKEILFKND